MTFAEKIIKLREAKGWKQSDLRRAIGKVSATTVSNWETGSVPSLEIAFKIAKALNVSLDFLADDTLAEEPSAGGLTEDERTVLRLYRHKGWTMEEAVERLSIDTLGIRQRPRA